MHKIGSISIIKFFFLFFLQNIFAIYLQLIYNLAQIQVTVILDLALSRDLIFQQHLQFISFQVNEVAQEKIKQKKYVSEKKRLRILLSIFLRRKNSERYYLTKKQIKLKKKLICSTALSLNYIVIRKDVHFTQDRKMAN